MATEYFLSSGNRKLGPFTERQITAGVRAGKISLFDHIYNRQTAAWVMLMQHPDFCDLDAAELDGDDNEESGTPFHEGLAVPDFDEKTVVRPDIGYEAVPDLERPYWYEKSHPDKAYKFLDLVSLLHKRTFFEHTLIAKTSQGPWKPVIDWDEFSVKSLAEFQQKANLNIPDFAIRRRYPRFDCGKNFIIVAQGKGFRVFCPDISQSGMSFIVKTPKVERHESLAVKFKDTLDNNNFDAKAVVVGLRRIRITDSGDEYIRYALRFTHFSVSGRKFISALTSVLD